MSANPTPAQAQPIAALLSNLAPTAEDRAAYKARIIEMGERSFIDEKMNVQLPAELHGEWVGIDESSQWRAISLGFVDGEKYIKTDQILHAHPEGGRIGDVKFMVCPKWQHEERTKINAEIIKQKYNLKVDAPTVGVYNQMRSNGIEPMRDETPTGYAISGDELSKIISN